MNQQATEPVRLGIAGAGGFARHIADLAMREGGSCQPCVQLLGVAEPDTTTHAVRLTELRQRGIETPSNVTDLLANKMIEAVWLPVPIALHRPMTEQALAADKAVMVEKPAAGAVQDVAAMIAARDRTGRPVVVGFQHMYEPSTAQAKRWLLEGRLGAIRHATLHACWPRSTVYFKRNNWAGRFQQGGVWVMDSPANNALSHFINLLLFFLGPTLHETAATERIEAELYRAQAIENFDTISLRAHLPGGATALILMTHSCREGIGPVLVIEGEHGRLRWTHGGIELDAGGRPERLPASTETNRHTLERFARLVRGEPDDTRLVSTLETARAQVQVINAASEAATIVPVPVRETARVEMIGEPGVAINGIESAFAQCVARRQMLHESGLLLFTRPAGSLDTRDYRHFAGPRG